MSDIIRRDPRAEWIARNRLHPLHAAMQTQQTSWMGPNGIIRKNPHAIAAGFIGPSGIKRIDRSGAQQGGAAKRTAAVEVQLPLHQVTDYRRGADIYWSCQTTEQRQALCVLLPMTTLMEAKQFIERVKAILRSHARFEDHELALTGPLLLSAHQTRIEQLLNELGAYDEDLADTANPAV